MKKLLFNLCVLVILASIAGCGLDIAVLGNGGGYGGPVGSGQAPPEFASRSHPDLFFNVDGEYVCADGTLPIYRQAIKVFSVQNLVLVDGCTQTEQDLSSSEVQFSENGNEIVYQGRIFRR